MMRRRRCAGIYRSGVSGAPPGVRRGVAHHGIGAARSRAPSTTPLTSLLSLPTLMSLLIPCREATTLPFPAKIKSPRDLAFRTLYGSARQKPAVIDCEVAPPTITKSFVLSKKLPGLYRACHLEITEITVKFAESIIYLSALPHYAPTLQKHQGIHILHLP